MSRDPPRHVHGRAHLGCNFVQSLAFVESLLTEPVGAEHETNYRAEGLGKAAGQALGRTKGCAGWRPRGLFQHRYVLTVKELDPATQPFTILLFT